MTEKEATHRVAGPSINLGGTRYFRDDPVAPSESTLASHPDFFEELPESASKKVKATVRSPPEAEDVEDVEDSPEEASSDEDDSGDSEEENDAEDGLGFSYKDMTVKEIQGAITDHDPSDEEIATLLEYEEARETPRKTLTTLYRDRLGYDE